MPNFTERDLTQSQKQEQGSCVWNAEGLWTGQRSKIKVVTLVDFGFFGDCIVKPEGVCAFQLKTTCHCPQQDRITSSQNRARTITHKYVGIHVACMCEYFMRALGGSNHSS